MTTEKEVFPWAVSVVELGKEVAEKTLRYRTEREAEKAERALLLQIDTDRYYTRVEGPA